MARRSRINLFAVAEKNAPALRQRFADHLDGLPDPERTAVEAFARQVEEEGKISINMPSKKLRDLVADGRYLNPHQRAEEEARRSGKDKEALLRDDQKEWYEKRVTFERRCVGGETFNYGALNIGGAGTTDFGEFAVLFHPTAIHQSSRLVYLWADSLRTYVTADLQVNGARLREDCTPESAKHCLAGLKHTSDIPTCPCEQWPTLLCGEQHYVEAIIGGAPRPNQIALVRMRQMDYDEYESEAFEAHDRELSEDERGRLAALELLLTWVDEQGHRGVRLELVDD